MHKGALVRLKSIAAVVLALALSSYLYADNPFVGRWKIDKDKSLITGTTDSVAAAGPNTWKFQDGAFTWTVKADGTDQPAPFGSTVSMTVVNPTTWEFTNKSGGKTISSEAWVLAADGVTMTRTFSSKDENGNPTTGVSTMKRTPVGKAAGKNGFEGTWESTKVDLAFTEVDIEANGDDGITVRVPLDGTHYSLKFDGKEYPEEGPRLPAGMTVSAVRVGPRHVEATTRINGKVFDHEDWELSEDGTTYTYTQRDEGSDKPVVIVLHTNESPMTLRFDTVLRLFYSACVEGAL